MPLSRRQFGQQTLGAMLTYSLFETLFARDALSAEMKQLAAHWIKVQAEEFKRLGIEGDWDNPYTTMAHDA